MADLAKVKRNISKMIGQGAPEADIDAYVSSEGVTLDQLKQSPAPAAPVASSTPPANTDPKAVFQSLIHQESGGQPGIKGTQTQYGQALGLTQLLPDTGKLMAQKLGVPWHPELLTAKSKEGYDYQALLGAAYYDEGLQKYGGDARKALMYYHGGPDEKQWGPKTHWYADAVLARANGQPIPKPTFDPTTPDAPMASAIAPPPAVDRKAEIEAANAEAARMANAGSTLDDVKAFLAKHGLAIKQGEESKFGKGVNFATGSTNADPSLAHTGVEALKSLGRGATDTVGGILNMAPQVLEAALTGNVNGLTKNVDLGLSDAASNLYDRVVGKEDAKTTGERYVDAAARGVGQFAVPLGAAGKANKARRALLTLTSGASSGLLGQAAADAAPALGVDPDKARMVGQIAGGIVGGAPVLAKPIARERFIERAANDARGPYLPGAVDALATKAADESPNGVVPKGRAKLTDKQINAVANQHLVGMEQDLTRLSKAGMVDPQQATALKRAIQNKNGITQAEINALKGTPEGDAVAEGLNHYRAVNALTKPYGGSKPGILPTLAEMGTNIGLATASGNPLMAASGTILRRFMRAYPGDVNASRIRGADKAIKNKALYDKLQERIGPSPVAPAMDTFKQRVAETYAPQDASATGAKLSPADALIKVNIESGVFGRHNLYADSLGVKRTDVEKVLPNVKTDDIPAFEMDKFRNGYPISKSVRTALLPRLRKALADEGITPSTASNQATKAAPTAEGVATDERIYRPVEDQARYDMGKSKAQSLQNYERAQFERQMPKEVVEATKSDIDHIIDVSRTGESGLRYFDEQTAPKLRQMGMVDHEIDDIRSHIERIVSHKRYRTDAAFEAGAMRK